MSAIWQSDRRRVLVVLGTAPQPFTRLVEWADAWSRDHPDDEVLVQYGFSAAPAAARSVRILPPDELHDTVERADVVITHGGPGAISAVRGAGKQPLVLARDPAFGEMVDGHQMRFAAWASERGFGSIVADTTALSHAVAVADENQAEVPDPHDQIAASVEAFRSLAVELLTGGAKRRRFPTLRRPRVDQGATDEHHASPAPLR